MYGGSFGYDSSLGNNSSLFNLESAGIWVIISFVIALVGGICLYFTVFSDKNEKSYTGFMAKLYEFVKFKKNVYYYYIKGIIFNFSNIHYFIFI